MYEDVAQIEAAIAALEAQRAVLGDAVVETALAPLHEKLALLQKPESQDERKRVSVLFADVKGYTVMSERLDPEDVTLIMNRLFDALTAEINRFGGAVDKYSGDAVMALFGAPRALENHEEMAVRAALAMQMATESFSRTLQRERGLEVALRIGINTGEVMAGLVGGLGSRSYTVMGDTVNLAKRLEHASQPGRVLISAATARPIQAIFEFEPPQQITVKGKTLPITVYLVAGERAERGRVRGLAGLHAPMIGREAEMARLKQLFAESMAHSSWELAAVVGEAGIGKTRLRREFVAWATGSNRGVRLLTARGYTHTQSNPYHMVNELVRALFGIDEEMDGPDALTYLQSGLQIMFPVAGAGEHQYLLGSLASVLGLSFSDNPLARLEPEQRRDRIFLSLEKVLLAAAALAPLLIVVEDLHWADALSLAFFDRLVRTVGDAGDQPAFLLIISRPPEREGEPFGALLQRLDGQQLFLSSLDDNQAGALVEALVDQRLPADLLRLIANHTQGNPLFVEEVLRAFIEEGALVQADEDGWQLARPISDLEVPPTVQDLLSARLDRLPPNHKQVVQYAAIVGRTFWQQLLAEILPASCVDELEPVLESLQARQLIQRLQQSQLVGDWEWIFRHVLIQEVAYVSLPRRTCRRVHRQVGQRLEAIVTAREEGGRAPILLPRIAFHYEHGDEPAKAVHFLHRAGELAAGQYANEDAIGYFSRALALLEEVEGDTREQQFELLMGREAVYRLLGEREAQHADLEQLAHLAEGLGEVRDVEVMLRHAGYHNTVSEFPAAIALAQEVIRRAEVLGDVEYRFEGQIVWAQALWRQGEFEEARTHLEEALALARSQSDPTGEATSLFHLGTVLYFLGERESARRRLQKSLEIRRAQNNVRNIVNTLTNLSIVFTALGDLGTALNYNEQALETYRSIGDRQYEAVVLNNLGANYYALGDITSAQRFHEEALALSQALADPRGQAMAALNLALVHFDTGDPTTALAYSEQALRFDREIGDRYGEGYSLTYKGLILEALGELEAAGAAYAEARALRQEIGQEGQGIDSLAGLARVAFKQGETAVALAHVEAILSWIEQNSVEDVEYPVRVYLTAADILEASGQGPRAVSMLAEADRFVKAQAAKISDSSLRTSFLKRVPLHQELQQRLEKV